MAFDEGDEYIIWIVLACLAFLAVVVVIVYVICYGRRVFKSYENYCHDLEANLCSHKRELREEYNEKEGAMKELQIQKDKNKELRRKLEEETKAKVEALTRLSEKISQTLTDNNPNIADLSDANRPTNLVEKFSTLYDDEWTNALEDLQRIPGFEDERAAIRQLLDIIMECFRVCREKSAEQLASGLVLRNSNIQIDFSGEMRKIIKDKRKRMADADLPILHEKIHSMFEQEQDKSHVHVLASAEVQKYIERCTEISWLMAVQDPPMAITAEINQDFRYDKLRYREYTKKGGFVDYVVWPAVLIQDGGHLMSKGIVQCRD